MHLTEISVTLRLPVHESDMTGRILESVRCQVDNLIHVSPMKQTLHIQHNTFSGLVMNYNVDGVTTWSDMGPVSLSVWSQPGLDLGESVIRVTFGSEPSQPVGLSSPQHQDPVRIQAPDSGPRQ